MILFSFCAVLSIVGEGVGIMKVRWKLLR